MPEAEAHAVRDVGGGFDVVALHVDDADGGVHAPGDRGDDLDLGELAAIIDWELATIGDPLLEGSVEVTLKDGKIRQLNEYFCTKLADEVFFPMVASSGF